MAVLVTTDRKGLASYTVSDERSALHMPPAAGQSYQFLLQSASQHGVCKDSPQALPC